MDLTYEVSALLNCVLGICNIGDATHLQNGNAPAAAMHVRCCYMLVCGSSGSNFRFKLAG
jgi:hypothetical protein